MVKIKNNAILLLIAVKYFPNDLKKESRFTG
jgi:hypothetical protein